MIIEYINVRFLCSYVSLNSPTIGMCPAAPRRSAAARPRTDPPQLHPAHPHPHTHTHTRTRTHTRPPVPALPMGIFASVGLGGSGVFYMLLGLCAVVATETLVKAYKCDASFGRLEGVQKNTVLLFMQSWGLWMMYCGAGCVMTLRMGNAKSTSAMCTIMFLANAMQVNPNRSQLIPIDPN
eukprot:SAG31_NODE_3090_length_4687_cov_4.344377_1_plen_181_part_00